MAPKGKLAKENAVPQNDNVPTAINVVNEEPPASTTSITTATSEVATPKTKLNTSQWVKISLKKCLLSRKKKFDEKYMLQEENSWKIERN